MTAPVYRFLPWARRGLAHGIETPDGPDVALPARPTFTVDLDVGGVPATTTMALYGPGDVTGIDRRAVLRTDPAAGATDREPNYLVAIDFDPPDFPWMFTPGKATGDRLRPWCVLIVVERTDRVTVSLQPGAPLPVLGIPAPEAGRELPDLADSWAWAHGQILEEEGSLPPADLELDPDRNLSRLVSSRLLQPNTRYLAAVVPAFNHGVQRGLGRELIGDVLAPAWDVATVESVELPMYHFWEFATAVADDIESMAERLHGPEHTPPALGRRRIFAAAAHPDVPPLPEQARAITMFGALRPTGPAATPLPPQPPQLTTRLADVVGRRDTPELPPPLYGEWAADEHALPPTEDGWFGELNRTVAHRIASGLGAEVVRRNQETYVDAAWRQVGRIREANDLAARARLSAAVLGRLVQRHVASLPADRLLQAVAPVLGVTPGPPADLDDTSTTSMRVALGTSSVPTGATAATFRRLASMQRPAVKRAVRAHGLHDGASLLALTAGPDGAALVETTPPTPDGIIDLGDRDRLNVDPNDPAGGVSLAPLGLQGRTTSATIGRLVPQTDRVPDLGGRELPFFPPSELPAVINMVTGRPRRRGGGIPIVRPPIRVTDQTATNAFDGALGAMARSVDRAPPPVAFVGVDVAALGLQLLERLDPRRSVGRRVSSMVVAPQPVDPFAGIMAFPILPEATYTALDALGGGWMLPSADGLEPDTAILLQTNPGFTAAFLVGMNHEMNAELLWRVYPTDQRGTPFQRFWDRDQGSIDIVPVHQWPLDQPLATAGAPPRLGPAAGATNEQIVLLLRGQLLRRYPDMVVYAVKGTHAKPGTEVERQGRPVFAGRLSPDLNFVGFDMTAADLAADEWWFVLEQQLTAPRFGFDIEDLPAGDHVDVATLQGPPGTADRVAAALLQLPIRVALHRDRLLLPVAGP